jgi:hypothetical protein
VATRKIAFLGGQLFLRGEGLFERGIVVARGGGDQDGAGRKLLPDRRVDAVSVQGESAENLIMDKSAYCPLVHVRKAYKVLGETFP